MTQLATLTDRIPAMLPADIAKVREYEAYARTLPQVRMDTNHVLHGGLYLRTITIPAGVLLTGVLIRVPTALIFVGDAEVNTGDGGAMRLTGHHVLAASAGRKQAFLAHQDTTLTMVFPTRAKTVSEAEDEFTDEPWLLASREPDAVNHINITGE